MSIGAALDILEPTPFLRLDPEAEEAFVTWRGKLERRLRAPDGMQYMLEGHISKYRKLVPILALINHLADEEARGPISGRAMERALRFAEYLESHAQRIYASGKASKADAAKAILDRIGHRYLAEGFTVREITHEHHWTGLKETDDVVEGLNIALCTELAHTRNSEYRRTTIYNLSHLTSLFQIGENPFGTFGIHLLGAFSTHRSARGKGIF